MGRKEHPFLLVEFKGEPLPKKSKKGHHWATEFLETDAIPRLLAAQLLRQHQRSGCKLAALQLHSLRGLHSDSRSMVRPFVKKSRGQETRESLCMTLVLLMEGFE